MWMHEKPHTSADGETALGCATLAPTLE